jgi:hypothetical protein
MKKNDRQPKEMELVGGGLEQKTLNQIRGGRCICSSGQASAYMVGGCQCDFGPDNGWANDAIAHEK